MTIHVDRSERKRLHFSLPRVLTNRPWRKVSAAIAGVISVGVVLTILVASGGVSGIAFGAAAAAVALGVAGLTRVMVGGSGSGTHDNDPLLGDTVVHVSGGLHGSGELSARTYTVVSGDTLWAISERFYGDGARYRQIAAASGIGDDISDPEAPLNPGRKLTIPLS